MLKAILFDMDDTIIDWGDVEIDWETAYHKHMASVFDFLDSSIMPMEVSKEVFITRGWETTLNNWVEARETLSAPHVGKILIEISKNFGVPENQLDMQDLMDAYGWEPFPGVRPFEDALEVLPDLKASGVKIGLVTNAAQPITIRERELEAFGLIDFIEEHCRVSAADVGYLKPHPAIFEHALELVDATPEEVVFVGDTVEADIIGAQKVGMKAVLRRVAHKQGQMNAVGEEVMPDAQIDTLHELYPLLDKWFPDWRQHNKPSTSNSG